MQEKVSRISNSHVSDVVYCVGSHWNQFPKEVKNYYELQQTVQLNCFKTLLAAVPTAQSRHLLNSMIIPVVNKACMNGEGRLLNA